MPRNDSFVPSHEPLRTYESLHLQPDRTSGSFSFLNPTRARYHHKELDSQSSSPTKSPLLSEDIEVGKAIPKSPQHTSPVHYKWRARDNRKGRHALVIESTSNLDTASIEAPAPTHSFRAAGQGIWRMCTQFPYWNISYLVATIFTLGSVIWVMNAFFVYLPLAQPQTEFNTEILYGGGITAFIGATVFEIGSVLLMIEAVNENRAGCFGWALERLVEGEKGGKEKIKLRPDLGACAHHHTNKRNFVGKGDGGSYQFMCINHLLICSHCPRQLNLPSQHPAPPSPAPHRPAPPPPGNKTAAPPPPPSDPGNGSPPLTPSERTTSAKSAS